MQRKALRLGLAAIVVLLTLFNSADPVRAQTLPAPDWLARALTNRPPFTRRTNAFVSPSVSNAAPAIATNTTRLRVGGLTAQDEAMANAVVAENTLTLNLPGLGTSVDGPGPLTEADRLGLPALNYDASAPPPALPKRGRGQNVAVDQSSHRPFPNLVFRVHTNN